MRRVLSLLVLGLISLLSGPLAADQVVLRDGRTLDTKKPPEIRGRQAILVLADGKLVSIPAAEIDAEKTAELARKAAAAVKPASTPVPGAAGSLTEAARATRDGKKATVVLTDQDVAGGWLEPADEKKGPGAGRVVVSNVSARKVSNGTSVTGSVQNVGGSPVEAIAVTVEVVGDKGQTVASAFGQLSADALGVGEKATFTALLDAAATAANVRALPRWRSSARESESTDAATGGKPAATKAEAPAPEPSPAPAPTRAPEPTPPPRPPDVAAPPANAPVGAPSQPGGTYVPQPSSDQPKPPGGGA